MLKSSKRKEVPQVIFEDIKKKYKDLKLPLKEKIEFFFPENKTKYLDLKEIIKFNLFMFKSSKRLEEVPQVIFEMENLKSLDLSYQAIKEIPDQISALKNLERLILDNCIKLENISHKLAELSKFRRLELESCFLLKNPPFEIVKLGFKSIITFFKQLSEGFRDYKQAKLMFVGLGKAGKTSLFNSLKKCNDIDFKLSDPEITDGIKIEDLDIELEDHSILKFSTWDFAGQEIYYNTHQFFLSSRGIYLLVWNIRQGRENTGLEFWLNSISCHAPYSKVFVVGTHIDEV